MPTYVAKPSNDNDNDNDVSMPDAPPLVRRCQPPRLGGRLTQPRRQS
jgi:hypothetical protein